MNWHGNLGIWEPEGSLAERVGRNPLFAAYARFHGRTVADQLDHDRKRLLDVMTGFLAWNRARKEQAARMIPEAFASGALRDHDAYDAWLDEWVRLETGRTPKCSRSPSSPFPSSARGAA